jgi:hypothetical protein
MLQPGDHGQLPRLNSAVNGREALLLLLLLLLLTAWQQGGLDLSVNTSALQGEERGKCVERLTDNCCVMLLLGNGGHAAGLFRWCLLRTMHSWQLPEDYC